MTMDASERTPYAHALGEFARRETLRLNTPGHNASELASEALAAFFGPEALLLDAQPLLSGLDKGDNNPFDRAVLAAARAWGARRSWFLTNGASQGNRMAALAIAQYGEPDAPVITQRSAHSSFIDGIILGGISPRFVQPTIDTQHGINHGITPEVFAQVVAENPDAKASYVISPSYFGAVADIAALADIAHTAGIPLIVDGAWGAHFGFHPDVPENPLALGADVLVSSTHKLGGSLTQSAMIHVGKGPFADQLEPLLESAFSLNQSTSESALLLASLDIARDQLEFGHDRIALAIASADRLRDAVRASELLSVVSDGFDQFPDIVSHDPLHVSIDVHRLGRSGPDLREALMDEFGIYCEIASHSCIVALVGPGMEFDADFFVSSLVSLAAPEGTSSSLATEVLPLPAPGEMKILPRTAFFAARELVSAEEAIGRISADSLAAYPPGIPNVLPGEVITTDVVEFLQAIASGPGGYVRGAHDSAVSSFSVVREH
ncbi:aminotransferase class I/II-fold pyridoxal phosphate-dependent enzyme [Aurantimicrobium sp. MWH-Uga1]|uniref:aminotransferase class I/II-fold pyridoxal phosphate-dependent enzyme n=1 Tax=Aurantimicrobium sp. MWH-Uga1 TaxID=2079575 RepID=UPI000DED8E65|nr:DegT/DnrJ/EryC1/StrS family aminotransferase [Aurantimicrobium sp. MWH-Uga1]AXE53968.1 Arginine decarboxylase [Aurantimicrobium sp. MWH-Uga1]